MVNTINGIASVYAFPATVFVQNRHTGQSLMAIKGNGKVYYEKKLYFNV